MSQPAARQNDEREPLLLANAEAGDEAVNPAISNGDLRSTDDDTSIDEDVLNHVVSVFGTSLGMITGLDTGTPPLRKFSLSSRVQGLENQQAIPFDFAALSETERRKSYSTFKHDALIKPSSVEVENLDDIAVQSSPVELRNQSSTMFNNGLSVARFWAIFGSILLLYFVT